MRFALLIPLAALAACSAAQAAAQPARFGPAVVTELAGRPIALAPARPVPPPPAVPEPATPAPQGVPPATLQIEGARASGSTGCNQWSADVVWSSRGALRFGPVATTKMACEPAVMAQERAFLAALQSTTRAVRRGNELSLFPARGARLMRLRSFSARADQAPARP